MSIENDLILQIQGRLSAQEYALKFVIQVLHQLAPQSGLQAAMHQMLNNSISRANFDGDPKLADEMREYVRAYAAQIIDAGIGARPTK